ncbi:MAG: hemerythrin domain-containing protein [Porticoccaceae bacterium]
MPIENLENPIDLLIHEHRYILKVVHALSVIDDDLSRGQTVAVELIHKIVDFMRAFADKCHHAKEEAILFPAMETKGVPKTGCPLAGLKLEHVKGRELVTALEAAAGIYADGKSAAVEALRNAISGIRQLYPNHIWKEDEMVFPMAKGLFSPAELVKIKLAFDKAESELGQSHDQYIAFANEMALLHSG